MTYLEALDYVDSFINYEKTAAFEYPEAFKLDRMRALAKALGNPHKKYECVIIAGSKGKGSTSALLASILRMEDLRVGLFTSPHLADIRERIRVNGLLISEARFCEFAELLDNLLDTAEWRRDPPTYFEVLTAMAFWHFDKMKVHIAVLEVGLGGLYDSTNIAEARVVGLTPVSLEHTDKLGKTAAKIAVQKCGIIKGHETVIAGPQMPEVQSVLERAVEERGAELYSIGKELRLFERDHDEVSQRFDLKTPFGNFFGLEIKLLGRHQIDNAALAIGMAKALEKKARFPISGQAILRGLADAHWPGRIERVMDKPQVVLDGAHNVESAKRLAEAVSRHFHFNKAVLVFGSSDDKDIPGMIEELSKVSGSIVVTRSQNPRAAEPQAIAEQAEGFFKEVYTAPTVPQSLEKALSLAAEDDLVLVTGSLYVVGEARGYFHGAQGI